MEQLEENIAIFQAPLTGVMTSAEKETVAAVKQVYDDRVAIGCTACSYCMPCPHGVNIPQVFRFYNVTSLGGKLEGARRSYERMLTRQESDASLCVECGECEEACPQELPIIETLKKAHALLA
jgi:predicted aldo/keto reductase-like oxidoreductase